MAESFSHLKRRVTLIGSDLRRKAQLSQAWLLFLFVLTVLSIPGFALTRGRGSGVFGLTVSGKQGFLASYGQSVVFVLLTDGESGSCGTSKGPLMKPTYSGHIGRVEFRADTEVFRMGGTE